MSYVYAAPQCFFLLTIFVVYHLVMAILRTDLCDHVGLFQPLFQNTIYIVYEYPKVIYIGFYITKGNRLTRRYDQRGLLTRELLVKLEFHDHIYMVLKTLN